MEALIFGWLTSRKLPFLSKRIRVMRNILNFKRWQKNSYCENLLEVVIPCVVTDLKVMPFTVRNLRKFLLHPIHRICIVAPEEPSILDFCSQFNCTFIDENTVLPIKITDIGEYLFQGNDRRGWIFQQLLKLGADSFVETQYYYVLDADTVLTSPQHFIENNKIILNTSDEFHQPYLAAYKKLLGEEPTSPFSFVSHQMLFEKHTLRKLKENIEQHTGMFWYKAIIELINRKENSSFSEYETYGNYLFKYFTNQVKLEYFFNISLNRSLLDKFTAIDYQKYKSVSFHWYNHVPEDYK